MIDPETRARLLDCVRRESRSLMQYFREVPSWVELGEVDRREQVRCWAAAQQECLVALGAYLARERVGWPHPGPFPMAFTQANDAALHYLLPKLVREHDQLIAQLQADRAALHEPEALQWLERLLALKQEHREAMARLATRPHSFTAPIP